MEWKDLDKMTVLKLREEALKFPEIEGVHEKNKEQLMDELAKSLGIEKPHVHFAEKVVHTKWTCGFSIPRLFARDRKSTRLNSSHRTTSYAVFCLKKKKQPVST